MKKNLRHYLMLLLTFLVNLSLLVGCMPEKEKNKDPTSSDLDMQELRLNFVSGELPSLNPHELVLSTRGAALGKWLFEGLTRLNLKGEYEFAGAKKVHISPCKTRYTFTLKENRYYDRSLVTAHDYEKCWKKALAPDAKCLKAHLFYYIKNAEKAKKGEVSLDKVGITAVDDKTLVVELNHPTPHFLGLLSTCLYAPFKEKENKILSNGPYMVTKVKEDDYLELKPNPFFWDQNHIAVKKITVFMIKDAMTALSLYKKKDLDWIGDPFTYLSSEIASVERDKGELVKGSSIIRPFWIYLNTEVQALSSPLIRRAFRLVTDQREIAKHLFQGDDLLFLPVPLSFKKQTTDYDVVKGKNLFEKGLKELGLTKETFPTLKISACSTLADRQLAEYLQQKWQKAFGIKIELDIQDWNAFYAKIAKGNYQVGGFFTSSDYNDPLACLELLASKTNFPKWQHQRYMEIIERLKQEDDIKARALLLEEAVDILKEETPIIWLVNQVQYHGYPVNLKGVCFDQRGTPDFRYAYFK